MTINIDLLQLRLNIKAIEDLIKLCPIEDLKRLATLKKHRRSLVWQLEDVCNRIIQDTDHHIRH